MGDAGASAGGTSPVFPDELVRWVGMIFNGTFVPVIPDAPKILETYGRNLETYDAQQNHSVEKQWHLNILTSSCQ